MKVLFARAGGLGDSILILPVVSCIKKIYPGVELHILGNETMLSVARLSGLFQGFRSIDESRFAEIFSDSESSDFIKSYFSVFDKVFFFTAAVKDNIIRKVMGSGAKKCLVLDPRPPERWNRHIVEHLMTIIDEKKDNGHTPYDYGIKISDDSNKGLKGIVIHPGSGSLSKKWPLDRYLLVAEKITTNVTFILGPAEIEDGMKSNIDVNRFAVACPEEISELCVLMSSASLYIGNDSGVSHLAALCEIPSIVLFGPTKQSVWKPLGRNVTVISSKDGTMDKISLDDVIKYVTKASYL